MAMEEKQLKIMINYQINAEIVPEQIFSNTQQNMKNKECFSSDKKMD